MKHLSALLAAIVALSACPLPANADTGDDFAAAFGTFLPGGAPDVVEATGASANMISRIAGSWLMTSPVFTDGVFDAERAATACEHSAVRIAPTGRFGFTMTRLPAGEPAPGAITYTLVSASTFSRTTDLDGYLQSLFGDRLDTFGPGTIAATIASPGLSGFAQVHLTAPDVLVIETTGSPAAIYTRCPAA